MKKILLSLALFLGLLLQFAQTGCEDETTTTGGGGTVDTAASEAKTVLAYQLVETEMSKMINGHFSTPGDYDQLKFSTALTLYSDALTLNPGNRAARFGAALTTLLSAYADPEINKLIKDIDSSANSGAVPSAPLRNLLTATLLPDRADKMSLATSAAAGGLVFSVTKALKDPPLISRVQAVLRDNFLPKVLTAIDHLSKIDTIEQFKFMVTGKMQGDPSLASVALYPTEINLMNAMMHFLKFNLESMLIYKFELADYQQATLLAALNQQNTTFFVRATDGLARAAEAKSAFSATIAKMKKAIDYLQRISGNKQDAVIKLGNNGIRQAELDTLKTYLNKVESSLSSDISVEIRDADSDHNTYTIKVNLGAWFTNPPVNPKKDLLPAYTVSAYGTNDIDIKFNAGTYAEFTFPDPTMAGLFPGMLQETLKRLLFIDEEFAFRLEGYIEYRPWLGYWNPARGVTLKVYTAQGSYSTITDDWGGYDLLIRDAGRTPVGITKFAAVVNGTEYTLQNVSTMPFNGIVAKEHKWCPVSLTLAPVNLTLQRQTSPLAVGIHWEVYANYFSVYWQESYRVQRKVGTGAFADIPAQMDGPYLRALDYDVVAGVRYYYRVRTLAPGEWQVFNNGDLTLINKDILYSNEANITP